MSFHCRDFSLRFCTVQHDFSFVESTVLLHLTSVDRHVLLPAMVGELVTFSTSGMHYIRPTWPYIVHSLPQYQ